MPTMVLLAAFVAALFLVLLFVVVRRGRHGVIDDIHAMALGAAVGCAFLALTAAGFARAGKEPAPPPPIDDAALAICPPNRVAFCTSFCSHNPAPSCFFNCCSG